MDNNQDKIISNTNSDTQPECIETTSEEIAQYKREALNLIKKRYEKFYNLNSYSSPQAVNNIKEFLDWIKGATENDIRVNKVFYNLRRCVFDFHIWYNWNSQSSVTCDRSFNTVAYAVDDRNIDAFISDAYFCQETELKIPVDKVEKVANRALKAYDYSALYRFHVLDNVSFSEKEQDFYLDCYIDFQYHDKKGVCKKTALHFIVKHGIDYLPSHIERNPGGMLNDDEQNKKPKTGCYVATAIYGSYDCPQVWTLRRYRDNTLGSTWYGRIFIRLYYAISPTLVKWFGKTKWFNKICRKKLDRMVSKLNVNGVVNTPYEDIDWRKK